MYQLYRTRMGMDIMIKFIYRRILEAEFYILKANSREAIAENIRQQAQLDNWIRVASISHMDLFAGMGYLDLCEYWRLAILKALNDYIKQQNDSQKEVMRSIEGKMEKDVPYRSVLDSIPKSSLLNR